jgi:hypothetical protein
LLVCLFAAQQNATVMTSQQQHDMYSYENQNQRSPGSHRQPSQTIQRQGSRPFDTYGGLPSNNLYPSSEDQQSAQQQYMPRYPDRMGAATLNSSYQSFDPWGNAFPSQGGNTIGALGGTTRMKPQLRGNNNGGGRAGLPAVSIRLVSVYTDQC